MIRLLVFEGICLLYHLVLILTFGLAQVARLMIMLFFPVSIFARTCHAGQLR